MGDKKGMEIGVDINVNKMVDILKAISKHADALANELMDIEAHACSECGKQMDLVTQYADNKIMSSHLVCEHCGNREYNER